MKHKTTQLIKGAELLLKQKRTQARNPVAKEVRTHLIRQLFWGDRVLAAIRDGEDYRPAFEAMERNVVAAHAVFDQMKQDMDRR